MEKAPARKPLYKSLYAQVITAIIIGVILGHFWPQAGEAMKPLGDGFIKLIKMMIAPIIFCTVVVGIAGMEDMKKVGKTGGLALLYFEVVSSIALIVGLTIVNVIQPGGGMNVDPASLDVNADYGKQFAEEFLSASKFPKATFVSTQIQPGVQPGQGTMTGNLTLMGVTKPVTFNVTLTGVGHEPMPLPFGQKAAGFEATTTIKRSDFGSSFLNNLVGDDVSLQIEAEFDHK